MLRISLLCARLALFHFVFLSCLSLRLRHQEHGLLPGYGSAPGSDPNPLPNGATPDPQFHRTLWVRCCFQEKTDGLPGEGCGVECLVFSLTRTSSSSVRSSSCLEELSSRLPLSCLVLRLPLPLLSETVAKILYILLMKFLVITRLLCLRA